MSKKAGEEHQKKREEDLVNRKRGEKKNLKFSAFNIQK